MTVLEAADLFVVYNGSDGAATRALYTQLEALGSAGQVAINLFRAHKSSGRAKVYRGRDSRGRRYRGLAYDRKEWSLGNLCQVLVEHAAELGITWGWAVDPQQAKHCHVLYVELPTGQVSFHAGERGAGPDYDRGWDGELDVGVGRIVRWIVALPQPPAAPVIAEQLSLPF